MEQPASTANAEPSNAQTTIQNEDGTTKSKGKKQTVPKATYGRAKTIGKNVDVFSLVFPKANICCMLGSSISGEKWHYAEIRQSSNDQVWQQALQAFIPEQFAEKERNPRARLILPDTNCDPAEHEKALQLAMDGDVFTRHQYARYLEILAKVKKGNGTFLKCLLHPYLIPAATR